MLPWHIIAGIYFTNERSWHRYLRRSRVGLWWWWWWWGVTVTHLLPDMQTRKTEVCAFSGRTCRPHAKLPGHEPVMEMSFVL